MSDLEKITQQLQEVQHLSSTLQSELLSIQEGLLPLNKMGKKGKLGNLSLSDLLKIKSPPRPTISKCPVYFNPKFHEVGFDRCYALEDVLVDTDVIEKTTGGYKLKGKTLARGEEKFQKLLEEDDELRRKLLRKAGVNTIGTTKKQLEKIETNLFPVDGVEYENYSDSEEEEEDDE